MGHIDIPRRNAWGNDWFMMNSLLKRTHANLKHRNRRRDFSNTHCMAMLPQVTRGINFRIRKYCHSALQFWDFIFVPLAISGKRPRFEVGHACKGCSGLVYGVDTVILQYVCNDRNDYIGWMNEYDATENTEMKEKQSRKESIPETEYPTEARPLRKRADG